MNKVSRIFIRKNFHPHIADIAQEYPATVANKLNWTLLQLAMVGRTPIVKGVVGQKCLWRRSPLQGFHYYLWWLPLNAECAKNLSRSLPEDSSAIFVHAIRHHDETKEDLFPEEFESYREINIRDMNPLFNDQQKVAESLDIGEKGGEVRIVHGHPGSGKTVALQYAAFNLVAEMGNSANSILYVTFTSRLANRARQFFNSMGVAEHVLVYTLHDLEEVLLDGKVSTEKNILLDLDEQRKAFINEIQNSPKEAKEWKDDLPALWAEMRAYLFGASLPYNWKRGGVGEIPASEVLDLVSYRALRTDVLDRAHKSTFQAHKLAEKLYNDESENAEKFFRGPIAARRILRKMLSGDFVLNPLLVNVQALIVDEAQDLTLNQLALLAELTRQSLEKKKKAIFVLAADESQIVFPSGFDFGVVKDLLTTRLGVGNPKDIILRNQRRSPRRLAQLIDDSSVLYTKFLDKKARPKDNKTEHAMRDWEGDEGALIRWRVKSDDWDEVFDSLKDLPDAAIVAVGGVLENKVGEDGGIISANRILFTPASIKGLDRKVVFVAGLDEAVDSLQSNEEAYGKDNKPLGMLENRNLIDEIRVALSRSLHTFVIAETTGAFAAIQEFGLTDNEPVGWADVQAHLQWLYQDMDLLERIHKFLNNAEQDLEKEEFERALAENSEAKNLLVDVQDREITNQIEEQRTTILRSLFEQFITQANDALQAEEYEQGRMYYDKATQMLHEYEITNEEKARLDQLRHDIQLRTSIDETEQLIAKESWPQAYECYHEKVQPLLPDTTLQLLEDKSERLLQETFLDKEARRNKIAREFWEYAEEGIKQKHYDETIHYYHLLAQLRRDEQEDARAVVFDYFAKRYIRIPPPLSPSVQNVQKLLALIESYLQSAADVDDAGKGVTQSAAKDIFYEWLSEAFALIAKKPTVFVEAAESINRIVLRSDVQFIWNDTQFTGPAVNMLDSIVLPLRNAGEVVALKRLVTAFRPLIKDKSLVKTYDKLPETVEVLQQLNEKERKSVILLMNQSPTDVDYLVKQIPKHPVQKKQQP